MVDSSIKNKTEGFYNYCPSIIQTDDGTRYICYCTNTKSYDITDHIGFRKGTRNKIGKSKWSDEKIVLAPTNGSWDSHHTCDPSVVKGNFNIHDENIAPEVFQWGVGQSSLVNVDKNSVIKMYYTRGDKYGTRVEYVTFDGTDLSNINILSSGNVTNKGLYNLKGDADYLNNADFVHNDADKSYYAVSDCHPYPETIPNGLSDTFGINSVKEADLSNGEWTDYLQNR